MSSRDVLTGLALAALLVLALPGHGLAYVGPGAGLGMIGSLIAVVVAVFVAILGLLILPFRLLMKRRKGRTDDPMTKEGAAEEEKKA